MIRREKQHSPVLRRIPRESGDDPSRVILDICFSLVFPARAGMIPDLDVFKIAHFSIPRESGDDPQPAKLGSGLLEYSPRERG